jgi:hypothetical protein
VKAIYEGGVARSLIDDARKVSEIRNSKLETKPETRNPKHETRNPKPETIIPKPET